MNAFDFDNTIYDGESCLDLFIFCLRKDHSIANHIPMIIADLILYKLGLAGIDKVYRDGEKICHIITDNRDIFQQTMEEFWDSHYHKLKPEMLAKIQPDDVIITASPQFMLEGFIPRLGTDNILCSRVNIDTGKIEFLCYRSNKIKRFKELYTDGIDQFYTDSINDRWLIDYARHAFLVKKNKIKQLK